MLLLKRCPFTEGSPASPPPGVSNQSSRVCTEESLHLWDWMLRPAGARTRALVTAPNAQPGAEEVPRKTHLSE